MSEHSILGASSMHRWASCPGSVRLCKGLVSKSSVYADEGTKAHEIAAGVIKNGWLTRDQYDLDDETYEAIQLYCQTVQEDAHNNEILVEQRFDLSRIHPGCFGTADAIVYDPEAQLLRVYDYKNGKGVLVEVKNNPQLKYYGLGALMSTGVNCREVELVIVQPRATHPDGPIRRWRTDALDFLEFAADLKDFALATENPQAPLVPGDHCRFCPASGICPMLAKRALEVAQTEFRKELSYDPKKLSETLGNLAIIEAYAKAVREFAYNEALAGRTPPGYKLVEKRATRQWRDLAEAEKRAALSTEDLYDKPSLKSVPQVEKVLKKNFAKEFGDLVVHISSGLTLAPEDDDRPPAKADAKTEFTVIEEKTS